MRWNWVAAAIALGMVVGCGCRGGEAPMQSARDARKASDSVVTSHTMAPPGAAWEDSVRRERAGPRQHLIADWQIADLRREGLKDPVPTLVADLANHPELIPYPGELGGTMGFYDSTQIHVLDDQWVYAYFEDGHISGYGLFRYRVTPGGGIVWTRVSAHRDD